MSLSDKIEQAILGEDMIRVTNVKEFIRDIKKAMHCQCSCITNPPCDSCEDINEIVGDKLI